MKELDLQSLSNFFDELYQESDRGLTLVGSALIDEKLLEMLFAFLRDVKASNNLLKGINAPVGTFSSHIEMSFALGLIDDYEYYEMNLIRKIRNEFAHSIHGMNFQNRKIKNLCLNLQSDLPDNVNLPTNDPRFRFTNSIVCIVIRIFYRSTWIAVERCKARTWGENVGGKWILTSDKKPPVGVPVIALVGKTNK